MRARIWSGAIIALFCLSVAISCTNFMSSDDKIDTRKLAPQRAGCPVIGRDGTLPDPEPSEYPSPPYLLNPVSGVMNIIVLKVDFSDETPETPQATLTALFNGASNSLQHFYSVNSYGTFTVVSTVLPNSESNFWVFSPHAWG